MSGREPMSSALLILADARFPAGGHAHSGSFEPAAAAGTVTDISGLGTFLKGRLRTAGLTAAALAAAACHLAATAAGVAASAGGVAASAGARAGATAPAWDELDAEADARTPSPAQREASRKQGRALLRAARVAWPEPAWPDAAWPAGPAPHHAVVLGAATAAAGGTPLEAAQAAAYQSVAGPASAAVRLLALDPMRAAAVLARLAADIDETAARATRHAGGPLADLPCPSAPALDLLAEAHVRTETRLFES
jgi:urease accessory protein